jgi:hypothetical protein
MHNLKKEWKYKVDKVAQEKEELMEYSKDIEFKNNQLQMVLNSKTDELRQYLKRVETQCFEKSQILSENEQLDNIIIELQNKNV